MLNKDFIFGCATASYQIEGSIDKDGKVLSIWDTFTSIKGNIIDGSDGSVVCDSYLKYKDDVRLLKNLGVKAYRFSIAWSRVIDNNNQVNQKGLDYYINLSKELLNNGITPYVTLYHWDLPQWLMDKGGFLCDDISDYFKYYTEVVTKALNGLVKDYITINEPQCILHLGYRLGVHAPGLHVSDKEMLRAIHNLLLCHGKAVLVIRKNVLNSTIGFAPCSRPMVPVSKDKLLYDKCYNKYFELTNDFEYPNTVSIYSDPVFLGDYPKEYYEIFKDILPDIKKEDLELISQPLDYIYQNIYTGNYYSLDDNNELKKEEFYFGYPEGNIDWLQVVPESIYYGVKYLNQRYKLPVIISENGFCNNDIISIDGLCHDYERIDYINRYLIELEKASKELPIKGYFYWSLFDNFEWNSGLKKRFGLVYVDYRNGKRIEKDSYYAYKSIIKEALK